MFTLARPLAHDQVTTREDPIEVRIVMNDRFDRTTDIAEQFADLILASGETPLREVDLRIGGEQVKDRAARRCDATVVECFEIFQCDGLALLVGHGQLGECHGILLFR